MKQISKPHFNTLIRLSGLLSLIFFACTSPSPDRAKNEDIRITWQNNRATGIEVPVTRLPDYGKDSLTQLLKIRISNTGGGGVLGSYETTGNFIRFSPLIPLSGGLTYDVLFRDRLLGTISVPEAVASEQPYVLAVYPKSDTLPENLLKMYIRFSKRMREGEAQKHIRLLDQHNDTLHDIFLDLQPELWDETGKSLTLWLDPGRIKRDLIPNRQLGNPLRKGKRYTLLIVNDWKDAEDRTLKESYRKSFIAGNRDSLFNDPAGWVLTLPKANTKLPLVIQFEEPLDYFLLTETIHVMDENHNKIRGEMRVTDGEKSIQFTPVSNWNAGTYFVFVDLHLEDLAGNNLERAFDRDLQSSAPQPLLRREIKIVIH